MGSANQKHFVQFLFWTFIGAGHAAVLSLWRGVMCFNGSWPCLSQPLPRLACLAGSTVLAIFFTIFVVAMMCDQREAAVTDTTAIESQGKEINGTVYWWPSDMERSTGEGLNDLCGESCGLGWFIPTPMPRRYRWHPLHNPDAWDPRDPRIVRHFKDLQQDIQFGRGVPVVPPPVGESLLVKLTTDYLGILGRLEKEREGWEKGTE